MTRLSVNINKFATLRNARGGNNPDVVQAAIDCEKFGAQGITVHPRPDERHITYQDVFQIKKIVTTEFNIEGYPDSRFLKILEEAKPHQATLVPDPPDVLTSNAGWNTIQNHDFLSETIAFIKSLGIRTSLFIEPDNKMIEGAAKVGTDRVELYTEMYAKGYERNRDKTITPYRESTSLAKELGLGLNAGHDLDLNNLAYFKQQIPFLDEVSIGHALICDSLYFGLENTIQLYLRQLNE